ncbi:hypothetical protein [Salinisphaera sp.]|uniref:hypothetical protein n=1 Tax=Salinisphaera sp. TaxID=1914330 RepID=UPI000C58CFEC|nr:hypothetical protein [Salinisphaera sp.]MAS10317.1 hypothetical protein [Salinisphaera sp.]|tara:strand:+ start:1694 stop:1885 length:192 start_codon:yes stop_codon:yes gene_type:complete
MSLPKPTDVHAHSMPIDTLDHCLETLLFVIQSLDGDDGGQINVLNSVHNSLMYLRGQITEEKQ